MLQCFIVAIFQCFNVPMFKCSSATPVMRIMLQYSTEILLLRYCCMFFFFSFHHSLFQYWCCCIGLITPIQQIMNGEKYQYIFPFIIPKLDILYENVLRILWSLWNYENVISPPAQCRICVYVGSTWRKSNIEPDAKCSKPEKANSDFPQIVHFLDVNCRRKTYWTFAAGKQDIFSPKFENKIILFLNLKTWLFSLTISFQKANFHVIISNLLGSISSLGDNYFYFTAMGKNTNVYKCIILFLLFVLIPSVTKESGC